MKNQTQIALVVSVALNIFLAAFVMGKETTPMPPPPPPPPHMAGPAGDMPPPPHHRGDMPQPPHGGMMPPAFSPSDLFTPEEMKENFGAMRENFGKMKELRKEFADKLDKGGLSKEEILAHFQQVDQMMDSVKRQMQEKAAAKISAMPDEERKAFAQRMREYKWSKRFKDRGPRPGPEADDAPPPPPPVQ